ncbi:MAG: helix-turn-helix transcriptional regulator [Sciscionella sp.]
MSEHNHELRAAREATPSPHVPGACLSRQELADAVNAWLAVNTTRCGALDEDYIGRLEQGRVRWPGRDYRAGFRAVLGAPSDAALGFRPWNRRPLRPLPDVPEPAEARVATDGTAGSLACEWDQQTAAGLVDALTTGNPGPNHPLPPVGGNASVGKPGVAEQVYRSQQEWLRVRQPPGVRGRELTEVAAWLYPAWQRAPGGHVLTGPGWLWDRPVELDSVRLVLSGEQYPTPPWEPLDHVLPLTDRGERYANYSRAVRDLVRPRLLENRPSYRLLDVQTQDGLELTFGTTTFCDVFDVKQSLAHEFKAAYTALAGSVPDWDALPLRTAVGDPFNPTRLLLSPGISTLTIRRDRRGAHRFLLHERDGGKVADGGGLCHVMPAGEFQPSSAAPTAVRDDFSLWRTIMREFSEELLGHPEHDGSGSRPLDYTEDEPFRSFAHARAQGRFRLWHYGLVLEPLELGATQLTVAVIDDEVFDRLFSGLVVTNDEGWVVGGGGSTNLPFTNETIERLNPRLSASALTLLQLTWRDRTLLLA